MKKPIDILNTRKYFPIFWKTCMECGYKFKLEFGWTVKHSYYSKAGRKRYLCRKCALHLIDAIIKFRKHYLNLSTDSKYFQY